MTTLAIDIGGTKIAAAVCDENDAITHRWRVPTPMDADAINHHIANIYHEAVAAGHDHQVDLFVAVERIGAEVDQLRFDIVAVSPEYRADGFGAAFDFAFPGLGVVEKNSAFHRDRYCMIIASMAGEIYSS